MAFVFGIENEVQTVWILMERYAWMPNIRTKDMICIDNETKERPQWQQLTIFQLDRDNFYQRDSISRDTA